MLVWRDGCVGVEGWVFVCSDGCGWWVMGALVWSDGCSYSVCSDGCACVEMV